MRDFGLIFFSANHPRAPGFHKRTFSGVSPWRRFSQNYLSYDSEISTGARQLFYSFYHVGYKRYLKYFQKQLNFSDFLKSAKFFATLRHEFFFRKKKLKSYVIEWPF